jgi:hypothetical protein
MNFGGHRPDAQRQDVPDVNARLIDAWLENSAGERVTNVEQGEPIGFGVIFEARHDLVNPVFGFHFLTGDGNQVFGFTRSLELAEDEPDVLHAGQRVRLAGTIENRLMPGRYSVTALISRNRSFGDLALHVLRVIDFVVYGTEPGPGAVSVDVDVEAVVEDSSCSI